WGTGDPFTTPYVADHYWQGMSYRVIVTDRNGKTVSSEAKVHVILRSKVVVLDPGHDSSHCGASSGGLNEHELVLKISKYCREELEKYGVTVYLTRETNSCPSGVISNAGDNGCLAWRVNYAAKKGAAYLVSLHLNSYSTQSPHGAEILQQNSHYNINNVYGQSSSLARNILEELNGLGIPNRGVGIVQKNSTDHTLYPDGSLTDYYGILRRAKLKGLPAVIVEHCYISNTSDRFNYLSSDEKLKRLGIADAHGILKTLGLR
ncbi:N-acetylmuramoyl-L-alanine amidase, partial [Lachnospiraceae bacterium YH-ros2226]